MNYKGVIIEESLENKDVLQRVKILKTEVEEVTEKHQSPWLKQWTLHTVEVLESEADDIAEEVSKALDFEHEWYADFSNETITYIIFRERVFKIKRDDENGYKEAREYGISLGIPEYQVSFKSRIKK